jgi:uncharacterized membrane protein YcaP (DUF421 family)
MFDLQTLFFGDLEWWTPLEVALRAIILYSYAYFLIRLLGKRGTQRLTILEVVLIISLSSVVGSPMVQLELALLPSLLVMTIIMLLEQTLISLTKRNESFRRLVEGKPVLLIENGIIDYKKLKKEKITKHDLFTELRDKGIENLGEIKRAYAEKTGSISVYRLEKPLIGLSILPENAHKSTHFKSGEIVQKEGYFACWNCGRVQTYKGKEAFRFCPKCNQKEWVMYEEDKK